MRTKVIFKKIGGIVTAIFPELPGGHEQDPRFCATHSVERGHGKICPKEMMGCPLANQHEYMPLRAVLTSPPMFYELDIVTRSCPKYYQTRVQNALEPHK